jgi:hypothetical protein
MKIAFLDFWDNFDPNNNFFIHALRSIYSDIEVSTPNNADVIIFSCFGNTHRRFNGTKRIFYTGENKRPDYRFCDYSMSFDFNDYGGRNIRIPLWYLYIDWFGTGTYSNPEYLIPVSYLDGQNEFNKKEKTKFCSAVFSNPVKIRLDAIKYINSYKKVDCYGKVNEYKLPDGEKKKFDVISDYKFSICFENSLHPGYYTEKLLHAKVAGTIPLYFSDKDYTKDFNKDCCLNLIEYENMGHFLDEIKRIDNNRELYDSIYNEKLFKDINIENILKKITTII